MKYFFLLLGFLFSSVSFAQTSQIELEENLRAELGQVNSVYQVREDIIPNILATLKGSAFGNRDLLDQLTIARKKAISVTFSPALTRDSLAFIHFEKVQNDLWVSLSNVSTALDKYPALQSNDNLIKLLSQLEAQENRIQIEKTRYNEAAQRLKTFVEARKEKFDYQFFEDHHDGVAVKVDFKNETPPPTQLHNEEPEPDINDFIEITDEPKPIQNIQKLIVYPEEAKKQALEGKVTFEVLIGKYGEVRKIVIEKADYDIFRKPVIEAMKKVKFTPGKQNGKPVMVWYPQSVVFKLLPNENEPTQH